MLLLPNNNKMRKLPILFVLFCTMILAACSQVKQQEVRKPALMWFDADANFARFSSPDSIDFYLEKIETLGFTHAVVDLRPISGEVLYKSDYAPQMIKDRNGFIRDSSFDYLGHFIRKAHELGMEVHASLNVFVAGHNFFDRGPVYSDHPEWASMVYTHHNGIVPITQEKHKYSAMVNPIHPEYQEYILNILKEVAAKYPNLDGFVLDRVRYDGITADFSDLSRQEFEKYLGKTLDAFPEDIFKWVKTGEEKYERQEGTYMKQWIAWRAKNIYDFMARARSEIKSVNPDISFGTYTGAWYPSYYEVGVNFASNSYDPSKDFEWALPEYQNYGYAELLDLYTTGNYYTDITIEDSRKNNNSVWNETDSQAQSGDWFCVEGSCEMLRTIMGNNKVIGGILVSQFYEKPGDLTRTIEMNLKESDGLMVFDIVHIINQSLWREVEEGMVLGGAMKRNL